MGLEQRGNSLYYYEKERRGDRVVSRYFGSGEVARLAMQLAAIKREEADYERWKRKEERARHKEDDRVVIESERQIRQLLNEVFIAAGYHNHKGQWRKRRGEIKEDRHHEEGTDVH